MNGPEPQNQIILHVSPQQALAPFLASGQPMGGGQGNNEPPEPPAIDFNGIFQEIGRKWWVILLCCIMTLTLAVAYIFKAKRIYSAKAVMEVQQEQTRPLAGTGFGATDVKALEILKTIETKMGGEGMMLRIINSLHLGEDPTFAPPREFPYNDDELVFMLQKKATVALARGSRLIEITVEDTDPERAKKIADEFVIQTTKVGNQEDTAAAREVRASLEKERNRIRDDLEAAEKAVKEFRNAHPDMQLEEKPSDLKTNIAEARVNSVSAEVNSAKSEVLRLSNGIEQLRQAGNIGLEELLRIPAIATSEEVQTLQRVLNEKTTAFAAIDSRYLPKHPKHIDASKEVARIKANLYEAARKAASVMENKLEQASENERKLTEALVEAKKAALDYQKIASDFNIHASELKIQREHYDRVLSRLKEAEVAQDFGGNSLRPVSYPLLPTWPIRPQKKLILGGAGVAGVMMGLGIILLLKLMDRSVRNLVQGEHVFSLPGLAAIPESPAKNPADRLLTSPGVLPESAEAFRAMRTSLSLLGKGLTARSFLFTSPSAGDGKSYCATNYAMALAQQGYRTLLVDADLRKPTLDMLLLGRRNPAGLVTHLRGNDKPENSKACSPTSVANLYLFSAGESDDAHPAELLSGQAFRDLIDDALKWFHKVVIDTPPVNAVTDALLLAREVDSVALVIRSGKTSRSDARHAISKLAMAGARPVGFILNGASKEALSTGYTGDFTHATLTPLTAPRLTLPPPSAN